MRELRLGTRGSALALAQSRWVADQIERLGCSVELRVIRTTGDTMSTVPPDSLTIKGAFVTEIEQALLAGEIELAVHSMKDLPGEMPDELTIAAVPEREDPRDVLVGRTAAALDLLPEGAVVGTSSPRRRAQLLAARPDLSITDVRGNVDTRLRKLDAGSYDAMCMAAAGLHRLGLRDRITQYLDPDVMAPAVGQGALALQIRRDNDRLAELLRPLYHEPTGLAIRAERTVLAALGGGCSIPLGVLATVDEAGMCLVAALCSVDGETVVRERECGTRHPEELGLRMAERLKERGGQLLDCG